MTRYSSGAYLSGDQVDENGNVAFVQRVHAVTAAGVDAGLATAAKQPALGTAAAPSADVITVQGPVPTGTLTANVGNPFIAAALYSTASTQTSRTAGSANLIETNKAGNLKTVVSGFSTAPYDTNNVVLMPMSAVSNSENVATIGPLGILPFVNSGSANFYARGDAGGAVMQIGAIASARFNYAAASGGIVNSTTAVTFIAAAGAGVRNYVTDITIDWDALTNATEVAIRDGAAGTVLWRMKIPAGVAGMREVDFTSPRKGTANTLLEVVTLTASGAGGVYFNAGGYQGA